VTRAEAANLRALRLAVASAAVCAFTACGREAVPERLAWRVESTPVTVGGQPAGPAEVADLWTAPFGFAWTTADGGVRAEARVVAPGTSATRAWRIDADGDAPLRRAVVSNGRLYALDRRGRLRVAREAGTGPAEDLGVRVQPGSRLAATPNEVWIAGEAGGLARWDTAAGALVPHWETGDPPTSALASTFDRVAVGRVTGEVEVGRPSDRGAKARVLKFDAPVVAIALDGVRVAAADAAGHVRMEPPYPRVSSAWHAGGPVTALGLLHLLDPRHEGVQVVAIRTDGAVLRAPEEGTEGVLFHRLAGPVRAAATAGDGDGVFLVALEAGLRRVAVRARWLR
jgi:hypothetical protein